MSELKVGMLAIATMMSVIYMSMKVTSNQSGFGDYVTYRTIVKDASGIFPKTPIKVAGINAGRIKKIELLDNNALITFEVLEKVAISKDAKLRIKTVGFLGDKYLEIIIGDDPENLKHLGFIPSEEGGGMENIVRDISEVMKDVKVLVKTMRESLAADKNGQGGLKKIMKDMELMMASAKDSAVSMKNIISGNEQKINNMVSEFEKLAKNLSYQMDDSQKMSAMSDLRKILKNADKMMIDLQTLVADIKSGKGTVGKLLVEDEIADEVQETLASVKKLVGKVDSIRTELSLFTGANSDYGAETEAALKIFPSPERFYLLGLSTSEFGPDAEKETTTTVNGVATITSTKERQKDSYRFNAQIGRKLQNLTLRGGLIESTGGFGLDYDFSHLGSRFSFEVFDYRDNIGPNLRVSSEFQIYNVFYGKLAGEDLAVDERSATISAGLRFNDEDLKGLIGFFF